MAGGRRLLSLPHAPLKRTTDFRMPGRFFRPRRFELRDERKTLHLYYVETQPPTTVPAPLPVRRGATSPDDVLKLYFKSIGIQQGLSHQMVNAIVKDPQGFIWIGTAEGLNRYDGTEFHVYRHEPGNPCSLSRASWINCSSHHTGRPVVHRHGEGRKRLQRAKGKLRTDIGGKRLPQPAGQPAASAVLCPETRRAHLLGLARSTD